MIYYTLCLVDVSMVLPDCWVESGVRMEIDGDNNGIRVKATFRLGSESHSVAAGKGDTISEELVSMKEESMRILKEFITKHNVPADVPDELIDDDGSGDEDAEEVQKKPHLKSKKTKLT